MAHKVKLLIGLGFLAAYTALAFGAPYLWGSRW